jgi:hypothetical protein
MDTANTHKKQVGAEFANLRGGGRTHGDQLMTIKPATEENNFRTASFYLPSVSAIWSAFNAAPFNN